MLVDKDGEIGDRSENCKGVFRQKENVFEYNKELKEIWKAMDLITTLKL